MGSHCNQSTRLYRTDALAEGRERWENDSLSVTVMVTQREERDGAYKHTRTRKRALVSRKQRKPLSLFSSKGCLLWRTGRGREANTGATWRRTRSHNAYVNVNATPTRRERERNRNKRTQDRRLAKCVAGGWPCVQSKQPQRKKQ